MQSILHFSVVRGNSLDPSATPLGTTSGELQPLLDLLVDHRLPSWAAYPVDTNVFSTNSLARS
jgi:hypothetical protein